MKKVQIKKQENYSTVCPTCGEQFLPTNSDVVCPACGQQYHTATSACPGCWTKYSLPANAGKEYQFQCPCGTTWTVQQVGMVRIPSYCCPACRKAGRALPGHTLCGFPAREAQPHERPDYYLYYSYCLT